jgi:DNA-binding response OmpR family regulator
MIFSRKISLKAANHTAAAVMTAPVIPQEPATRPEKILVVDDDPIILQTLSLKLKSRGFQVLTARDGSEAVNVTRQEKPDLMVLDVNFPPDVGGVDWNGFVFAQWLRRMSEAKDTPVIVMSGTDRKEYQERATSAGAAAFFQKPIDNEQLLASIDMALLGKASGNPDPTDTAFEI